MNEHVKLNAVLPVVDGLATDSTKYEIMAMSGLQNKSPAQGPMAWVLGQKTGFGFSWRTWTNSFLSP